MKKKFIILSLMLAGIAAGVLNSQKVFAKDEYSVVGCNVKDDNGNIISYGNTCESGALGCISNPCHA